MTSAGLLGGLVWVPLLVALWIGVIGLGKAGRGGAWWTMLSGVSLVSLGLVVTIGGLLLVSQAIGVMASSGGSGPASFMSPSYERAQIVMIGGSVSLGLGFLLFAIGFALHGFQARRIRERIVELEMVIEAQNEQLARSHGETTA